MSHAFARARGAAAALLTASLTLAVLAPAAAYAADDDAAGSVSAAVSADAGDVGDVAAAGDAADAVEATSGATIASDLADYAPGSTVTLTGTGWEPGETVTIVVRDTDGASWSLTRDAIAGADGVLALAFRLPNYYVPNYDVTATGAASGVATTTFTDANVASGPWQYWMSNVSPAAGSQVTPGSTITYLLNAQKTGTTNTAVSGAVVFFTVAGGATITSVTGTGGNNGTVARSGTSLTWSGMNLNRFLNTNQTRYITVTVTVGTGVAGGQNIVASVNDGSDDNGTVASTGSVTHSTPTIALSCTQGTFYTVTDDGRLYQVTSPGVTPDSATTPLGTGPVWNASSANGLAITPGGTMAYAFNRGQSTLDILRYDPTTGVGSTLVTGVTVAPASSNYMVAGAVNPVDGKYYFGGYRASGSTNRFQVFVYNPTNNSVTQRGYIVPNGASDIGNSDILFDNQGNLYLSYSYNNLHELVAVTAANLAAGTSGQDNQLTTNSPALALTAPSTTYNGIAFDSSGRLFAQDASASGGATQVRTIDPGTGATLGTATTLTLTGTGTSVSATDLASCLYPGTVSVQKNLPSGRFASTNQFGLSISRGTTTQATATTAGTATGIQPQVAGPAIGVTNAVYTIAETAASGTVLANYTSTYECVIAGTTTVVATGSGTTLNYTFPSPPGQASAGPDILCTFTNVPISPATVTISKTVQDVNGANPQAGAGWTVGAALASGSTAGTTISTPATKTTAANGSVATPWSITFPNGSATATVVISETQQTGYEFVSGTCTITARTGGVTTVSLASASGTVPGVTPGASVSCVFTNKQQAGAATWQKVDALANALAGSTWTLTGPGVPANTIVSDCTVAPCATGAYADADATPGAFRLTGLAWGTYTLQEKTAPVGYVLSATTHTFTISATALTASVGQIVNEQQAVPQLPLTGGVGRDWFVLGGGGALIVALGILIWRRRRSRLST